MLFALLAKFLLDKPASVQAVVLGLCTGLFVAAAAEADQRDPLIRSTVLLVIGWGAAAAVATPNMPLSWALRQRHSRSQPMKVMLRGGRPTFISPTRLE